MFLDRAAGGVTPRVPRLPACTWPGTCGYWFSQNHGVPPAVAHRRRGASQPPHAAAVKQASLHRLQPREPGRPPRSHDCASEQQNQAPCGLQLSLPFAQQFARDAQGSLPRPCQCDKKQDFIGEPGQGAPCSRMLTSSNHSLVNVHGAAAVAGEIPEWVGGKPFKFCH